MRKPYLLIDANYLAHRAFHSTGHLAYGDIPTGVAFGFLRDIVSLSERFQTDRFVFCFDRGRNLRKELLPSYKSTRRKGRSPAEKKAYKAVNGQLYELRTEILPALGYRNIFSHSGYEADDVIAQVVAQLEKPKEAVIVSGDEDLYQLLGSRVAVFHPHHEQYISSEVFIAQYGIDPGLWAAVKAIAGCPTDDVPGVKGVGTKTAIAYICGNLKPDSKKFQAIATTDWAQFSALVELPYAGVRSFQLRKNEVTRKRWRRLCESLGFHRIGRPFGV